MDKVKYSKSLYKDSIQEVVHACGALRRDPAQPIDISLAEFVQAKWGISMETFYDDLGINPNVDVVQNIFTMPDYSTRWLVPELIRDALRLGLRKNPIWADIIASEQTIANPQTVMPSLNLSEAAPHYVGEGESIKTGTISYGQKTIRIRKMGRGIKIPYEVQQYVSLGVVGIFLQDFGIKLNQAIDALMIDVLINGEQTDGSESAPVVGVAAAGTFAYADLLKVWIRMARIGRTPWGMIGGENAALETLNLSEFKTRAAGDTEKKLDLKTPIPQTSAYYIHGSVPANQQLVIDRTSAILKFNAQPLLVEDEKIVSNQTMATYASLTTGFAVLYRDARVLVDKSLLFSGNGFPAYMDVDPLEQVTIAD